jgi:hypothetical protein
MMLIKKPQGIQYILFSESKTCATTVLTNSPVPRRPKKRAARTGLVIIAGILLDEERFEMVFWSTITGSVIPSANV